MVEYPPWDIDKTKDKGVAAMGTLPALVSCCSDLPAPSEAAFGEQPHPAKLETGLLGRLYLDKYRMHLMRVGAQYESHMCGLCLTLLRGCSLVENMCLAQVHCAASRAHQMNLPRLQQEEAPYISLVAPRDLGWCQDRLTMRVRF